MSKILITGVSSGIGRALTKELVNRGDFVWGIARRETLLTELKKELENSSKFIYQVMDVSQPEHWKKLIASMKKRKFLPEVIIFNAAIQKNDLSPKFDTNLTREMFDINFFGIIAGIESLLELVRTKTQFIAISSLSALKGSGVEGVGYPSSKAALSIAFESLHRKFGLQYIFKTIYFGPVASGMGPFERKLPIILTQDKAVKFITKTINSKQALHFFPKSIFLFLKLIKLLPSSIYFMVLSNIERVHTKLAKRK